MGVITMNNLKVILTAMGFLVLLSGCNTVAGFGKDLQKGGGALEKASGHKDEY